MRKRHIDLRSFMSIQTISEHCIVFFRLPIRLCPLSSFISIRYIVGLGCVLREREKIHTCDMHTSIRHMHTTPHVSGRQEKENLISSFSIVLAFVRCSVRVSFAADENNFFFSQHQKREKKIIIIKVSRLASTK